MDAVVSMWRASARRDWRSWVALGIVAGIAATAALPARRAARFQPAHALRDE